MSVHPTIAVGIAQINNSFSDQCYLPYVAGLLQAYTENFAPEPERYSFLLPLYKRVPIDRYLAHLRSADVIAFSTYVWNIQISLEVGRRLKRAYSKKLVIFGGPQVPDHPEEFLRSNDFIDVVVHGEGEQTFLRLLEEIPEHDWSEIPGISFLDRDGQFVHHPKQDRLREISQIPSPYISGTFDPLMAANPDETWIVLWETNRGCPFKCTFCDWGSLTQTKVFTFEMDRLQVEIDWFSDHEINYVLCCDANFGILKRDIDIARYTAAKKNSTGFPNKLSVQNTKNATDRAYMAQKILNDAGLVTGVTLAMQSVSPKTLEYIKRDNISLESYEELQRRFTEDGVTTYTDIILGLPGETYESFVDGVSSVIENGQHNRILFSLLSILPNAEMGDPEYQTRYGLQIVQSRSINTHGFIEEFGDGIYEMQDLVIASHSTPRNDWRKTYCFALTTALLHFDKLLQIPFLVAHRTAGVSFRDMIEAFAAVDGDAYPLLGEIRNFLVERAQIVQDGGPEHIYSQEWLEIYWPDDEYMVIKLAKEGRLDQFYREAGKLLGEIVGDRLPLDLLENALRLNRNLLKLPFQPGDAIVEFDYDVFAYCHAIRTGQDFQLERNSVSYRIERSKQTWSSWEDWMREVIWFCNRSGKYLYEHVSTIDAAEDTDQPYRPEPASLATPAELS